MDCNNIIVVSHEDAARPNLGPDFESVAGMDYLKTDYDVFWDAVIDKLGGTDTLKGFVPFDAKTLATAYAKDENFNTPETSLRKWDAAGGWEQAGQGRMVRIGSPLQNFLLMNGIRHYSPSECVCLLKRVARKMMEEQAHETT